ncbi:hypothetical protein MMC22_012072, partial [Lobaria immixta]|nr:hypothetical protein [Lobaria immixta]
MAWQDRFSFPGRALGTSHRPGHGIVSGNAACDIVEGKGFDAGLGYSSPLHPQRTCAIDVAPVKALDARRHSIALWFGY